MRIDLRYVSSFTYDGHVAQSHNALRARPAANDRQRVISYFVDVDPPAPIRGGFDYWGTWVDTFAVVKAHTRLTVAAEAVVETGPPFMPDPDTVRPDDPYRFHEYLMPSPHVTWNGQVVDMARSAVEDGRSYVGNVRSVVGAVGDVLTYTPGSTEVGTSIDEILEHRSGVCQDYAHLSIALFRSIGIPARYVSGYLYASDSSQGDEPSDDEITVSTHAWIEVPVGDGRWWALDPTNQLDVGERHVKIGHGRDYEDVTPLRGVYHGTSTSAGLEASVSMSRSDLPQFDLAPRPDLLPAPDQQQ
jgi:transglutaminase-like putative cysteine protease